MTKDELVHHCRTKADAVICIARLPEFGVPVELVADLIELVAHELAVSFHEGALDTVRELVERAQRREH